MYNNTDVKDFGLVSIITPSYNTAMFIGETIESVLAQTYSNWELLIVDDCSTDNTDEVVSLYQDPRIHYFKNTKNSGAAFSRNKALREAKGKWIAFLDSDDLWKPTKLEKQIRFMVDNQYSFSCTGREVIDENSNRTGKVVFSPKHVGKLGMLLYCWPGCLGTMYDSEVVGLIQIADLKKNNDYAMWLKVIKKCDFYSTREVLASYRVRKNSISHDKFKKLVKSHYILFKDGEELSTIKCWILVCCNLMFGVVKKLFFVKAQKKT